MMNDGPDYRRWWELHLRVARGELLGDEDRAAYDAGCRNWDESEIFKPIQGAIQARKELRALEAQRGSLEQRRRELDAETTAIEVRLAVPKSHG